MIILMLAISRVVFSTMLEGSDIMESAYKTND